ncbi:MAG: rhodanese-like domain-containing protein [Verrucomicrobiales bacterium]|nr:rhodanese-like domain-containing protein [Verrucomicrobiales bacterium]
MSTTFTSLLAALLMMSHLPASWAADAGASDAKSRKIQTEEFDRLRTKPNYLILDVRTPEEFKAGHVKDAINLNIQDPAFAQKVSVLDRSKTYLIHCARGGRSAKATDQLLKAGLTNVLDFTGGFEAWKKAGKPVTKE